MDPWIHGSAAGAAARPAAGAAAGASAAAAAPYLLRNYRGGASRPLYVHDGIHPTRLVLHRPSKVENPDFVF